MTEQITSLKNPAIKVVRGLVNRKARDESGLFFVEGIRSVAEATRSNAPIERLIVEPDLLTDPVGREVVRALERRGVAVMRVSAEVMAGVSRRANPKGLAAIVRQRRESIDALRLTDGQFALALDEVADPGNLGTILRTCDAVGAAAVILIGHATDPYHPTAVSASTEAIFTQRLIATDSREFADWKRAHGYRVVGTFADADTDYRDARYERPLVLLMGNESVGLSGELRALCDDAVRIPVVGRVSSLNLAVATGVLLYEIVRGEDREASGE